MSTTKQILVPPVVGPKQSQGNLSFGGIGYGIKPNRPELSMRSLLILGAIGLSLLWIQKSLLPHVQMDAKFAKRASSDRAFANFYRAVEESARKLVDSLDLTWEFELSLPDDPELPQWERVVLRMRPKGTTFEQSMKLWDKMDTKVREALKNQVEDPEALDGQKLVELQKRFFIEMDLSE